MKGRDSKQKISQNTITAFKRIPITHRNIKHKKPDLTYFTRTQPQRITTFFSEAVKNVNQIVKHGEIKTSIAEAINAKLNNTVKYFSTKLYEVRNALRPLYSVSRDDFDTVIWPAITTASAFLIGEYVTTQLSQAAFKTDDYDFIFKFLTGSAILGYSAAERITDRRIESKSEYSKAIASEILAISYLYSSSYRAGRALFNSGQYSLIASLGASILAVPATATLMAQKYQEHKIKHQYENGAQRSDTALIPAGRTPFANLYFQVNHALTNAMKPPSSMYQAALIANNIQSELAVVNQIKNVPAFICDIAPNAYKKITNQLKRIEYDFKYNTTKEKVLRFIDNKPQFSMVNRYELKTGDMIQCDERFAKSSPLCGELIALQRDGKGELTQQLASREYSINLMANNGEDVWIKCKTNEKIDPSQKYVDLKAIRERKQTGILNGSKIDVKGDNDFFIRIKPAKERTSTSSYEKTSEINIIINQYKTSLAKKSIISSLLSSLLISRDLTNITGNTLNWMFTLFQMFIPFAESFLRDSVNRTLLNRLNSLLAGNELTNIDALRIVDFINALSGYYNDRFSKGVAIITDKTGTLTTNQMDVHGYWTSDMPFAVQQTLKENKSTIPLPEKAKQQVCFETFAAAFTNNSKASEPEEAAIRDFFFQNSSLNDFKVEVLEKNHFRKHFPSGATHNTIETRHLGLYTKLGGRFTLSSENGKNYLVFCGTPRVDTFATTPLLATYQQMATRIGVLSRDWCLARCELSENEFVHLANLFTDSKTDDIEDFLRTHPTLRHRLSHCCTFIIDNPVKEHAEQFISNFRNINVPVFVATGDNAKAAENIARVLCHAESKNMTTIRNPSTSHIVLSDIPANSTVIFAGLSDNILSIFDQLMTLEESQRPVIIFSEMSTEDKGKLASHLKQMGFFIAANGDNTNDIAMMRQAHVVFAHLIDGSYGTGVEQFSNLNDKQLQLLCESSQSFYKLFDPFKLTSRFINIFAQLVNSQEKPSIALSLKTVKIGFELAKAFGASNVIERPLKHWEGIAFDLAFLKISNDIIINTADMPADNQHLVQSNRPDLYFYASNAIAFLIAAVNFAYTGESVNPTTMLMLLCFLVPVLQSIYSAYGETYYDVNRVPSTATVELEDENDTPTVDRRNNVLFRTPQITNTSTSTELVKAPTP